MTRVQVSLARRASLLSSMCLEFRSSSSSSSPSEFIRVLRERNGHHKMEIIQPGKNICDFENFCRLRPTLSWCWTTPLLWSTRRSRDTTMTCKSYWQAHHTSQVEFKVKVLGTPKPSLQWFKDDLEVFSSDRLEIREEEDGGTVIVREARLGISYLASNISWNTANSVLEICLKVIFKLFPGWMTAGTSSASPPTSWGERQPWRTCRLRLRQGWNCLRTTMMGWSSVMTRWTGTEVNWNINDYYPRWSEWKSRW